MTPRITRVKKHVHSHGPLSSVLAGAVGFGGGWSLAQAAEGLARVTPWQGALWGPSACPHSTFPPRVLLMCHRPLSLPLTVLEFQFLVSTSLFALSLQSEFVLAGSAPVWVRPSCELWAGQHRLCQPRLLPEQGPLHARRPQSLHGEPTQGTRPRARLGPARWGSFGGISL